MKKVILSLFVMGAFCLSTTAMAQDAPKKEAKAATKTECTKKADGKSCCADKKTAETKSCCADKKTADSKDAKSCCSAKKTTATADTKSAGKK